MCDVASDGYNFNCLCPVGYIVAKDGFTCAGELWYRYLEECKYLIIKGLCKSVYNIIIVIQ